jgi:hypothetical protein
MSVPFHPLADLFPLLQAVEFDELVADIKANGLREPIVLYQGQVLDGRNRYRACEAADVEPHFRKYDGDDPLAYVTSLNLHRRNLTTEQKREVIAKLLKVQPNKSDRQLAKMAKVDHKTIGSVRSQLEDVGSIPHVEVRTDTRGRKQPTARKIKPTTSLKKLPSSEEVQAEKFRDAVTLMAFRCEIFGEYCPPELNSDLRRQVLDCIKQCELAFSKLRCKIDGQSRAAAVAKAADRAEARAAAHGDDGLDIPPELRRAAP